MSLPEHMQAALDRMEHAARKIEAIRGEPASLMLQQRWLECLTDYATALADLHEFDREALDSGLHEVAERTGLERLRTHRPRPETTGR